MKSLHRKEGKGQAPPDSLGKFVQEEKNPGLQSAGGGRAAASGFESRVVFLRHGLSCANMQVKAADPSLCPLFPVPLLGASACPEWSSAKQWLLQHGWRGQRLYCSRLPRAIMTAQLLARGQGDAATGVVRDVCVVPGLEEEPWEEPASKSEREQYARSAHPPQWVDPRLLGDTQKIVRFVRAAWLGLAAAPGASPSARREYTLLAEHAQKLLFCSPPRRPHANTYQSALACMQEAEDRRAAPSAGLVVTVSHGNFLHNYLVQTDARCPQDPLLNLEIVRRNPTGRVRRFRFNAQFTSSEVSEREEGGGSRATPHVSPQECLLDPEKYCESLAPLWRRAEREHAPAPAPVSPGALRLHSQAALCPEHQRLCASQLREAQNEHFTAAYLGHTTWSFFHFFTACLARDSNRKSAWCAQTALIASFSDVVLHWLQHYPCQACRESFLSDTSLVEWLQSALRRCRDPSELHRIMVDLHNQINKKLAAQQEPPTKPLLLTYEEARDMWEF